VSFKSKLYRKGRFRLLSGTAGFAGWLGRLGVGSAAEEFVVPSGIDFLHAAACESDVPLSVFSIGFKDDCQRWTTELGVHSVANLKWLLVAFADEQVADVRACDSGELEPSGVLVADEFFEFGFIFWAAELVFQVKETVEVSKSLDVSIVVGGNHLVGATTATAASDKDRQDKRGKQQKTKSSGLKRGH
jgi:hypothetical protein